MKFGKKPKLQLIKSGFKNTEESTDEVIDRVLAELREEDGETEIDPDEQLREYRRKKRKRTIIWCAVAAVALIAISLLITLSTYSSARITNTYASGKAGNNSYRQFADGVIKYSKDGIAFVNRKGEENWNQPYQMKAPIIETYMDEAIVVANKSGNDLVVLGKDGLKGEMQTNLPIKQVAVSKQGIVAAILEGDGSPQIVCYDAAGNMLVELSTSLTGTGYPMDLALSGDGKTLLVSYMFIDNNQVSTKVVFYDFSEKKNTAKEYEVTSDKYPDMVAGEVFYLNDETAVVVGDNQLLFYGGEGAPKLQETVLIPKKIKSVFHDSNYVGMTLKNEGKAGYELCLFDVTGSKLMSQDFVGDYANVKISDNQVLLYDGKKCLVYSKKGLKKFEGEMDEDILEIFPVLGVNKYIVMSADGMNVVRFVK